MDLRTPKQRDFKNTEERKYTILYNYMINSDKWIPFTIIEGSNVILSYLLQKGYEEFRKYLRKLVDGKIIEIDGFDLLLEDTQPWSKYFEEAKIIDYTLDVYDESYKPFVLERLHDFKMNLRDTFSKHNCYILNLKDKKKKAQLYTYFMQTIGNNIRSSGDPFCDTYDEDEPHYYDVAKRMDAFIETV